MLSIKEITFVPYKKEILLSLSLLSEDYKNEPYEIDFHKIYILIHYKDDESRSFSMQNIGVKYNEFCKNFMSLIMRTFIDFLDENPHIEKMIKLWVQ